MKVRWDSQLCRVALGITLASCSGDRLLDKPPVKDAKSIIYIVHDETKAYSARLVPANGAPTILELDGGQGVSALVTAFEYNEDSKELGLASGALEFDPDGVTLPRPDRVYQASRRGQVWELLAEAPSVPSGFRVPRPRTACTPHVVKSVGHLAAQRAGVVRYKTEALSLEGETAFLHFPGEKLVTFQKDLSWVEEAIPTSPRQHYVQTGTVVLADFQLYSGGCLGKQRAGEWRQLAAEQWFCTYYYEAIVPGFAGSFALIRYSNPRQATFFYGRPEPTTFDVPGDAPERFDLTTQEQLLTKGGRGLGIMFTRESYVYSSNFSRDGEYAEWLGVASGFLLAGGASGRVFEYLGGASWLDLGQSGLSSVDLIVETPHGFLAVGGSGGAAEHLDSGWCPAEQVAGSVVTHIARLGSGYLLYSQADEGVAWIDVGF
ncbi:MAG: hypothetical protein U1E65_21825 [Myxococcota bacterium]